MKKICETVYINQQLKIRQYASVNVLLVMLLVVTIQQNLT